MDRNSIIGILLIAGILIVMLVIQKPSKKEIEYQKRKADSIALVKQNQAVEDTTKETKKTLPVETKTSTKTDTASLADLEGQYGEFAKFVKGENKFYTIENNLIKLVISAKGGHPYSVEIKKYKTFDQKPVILFSGDSTEFGLTFYNHNNVISTNNLYFQPVDSTSHLSVVNKADSISMRLEIGPDKYIEYTYVVHPDNYMIDYDLHLLGMNDIETRDPSQLDMSWEIYMPQQEQVKKNELMYSTMYYRNYNDVVDYIRARSTKDQTQDIPTKVQWVAFKDQFFSSILIADSSFSNALIKTYTLNPDDKYLKRFRTEVGIPFDKINNETIRLKMFFGPNKFKLLKQYQNYRLQDLASVGKNIIRFINKFIVWMFDWLNQYIVNFGIIILVLTVIIKIVLLPLTYRSYLSQAKMRILKPQVDEINAKYPKGKELEKQQAMSALYKKAGVNPLGGCLPMLLQFPILIAMYRFFPTSIELRQQSFLWAKDLSTYDAIITWHATIPVLTYLFHNHISLFTLLMTVTTIISTKMTGASASSQQMPGMNSMMYLMPVMFLFIFNSFSAGLTYYYFLTNLFSIGQNYLFKQFIDEKELLRKMEERKAKPVKKSGWQKRIEEMSKQRGYSPAKRK